jgi:hypothetical protein
MLLPGLLLLCLEMPWLSAAAAAGAGWRCAGCSISRAESGRVCMLTLLLWWCPVSAP